MRGAANSDKLGALLSRALVGGLESRGASLRADRGQRQRSEIGGKVIVGVAVHLHLESKQV